MQVTSSCPAFFYWEGGYEVPAFLRQFHFFEALEKNLIIRWFRWRRSHVSLECFLPRGWYARCEQGVCICLRKPIKEKEKKGNLLVWAQLPGLGRWHVTRTSRVLDSFRTDHRRQITWTPIRKLLLRTARMIIFSSIRWGQQQKKRSNLSARALLFRHFQGKLLRDLLSPIHGCIAGSKFGLACGAWKNKSKMWLTKLGHWAAAQAIIKLAKTISSCNFPGFS